MTAKEASARNAGDRRYASMTAKEPMQGVHGLEHLPPQAQEESMQGLSGRSWCSECARHEFGGIHLADVSLHGQLCDDDTSELLEQTARAKVARYRDGYAWSSSILSSQYGKAHLDALTSPPLPDFSRKHCPRMQALPFTN
jgi:hypothetical protein